MEGLHMDTQIESVLVTGATGFIGAHVVDTLLSRGLRVKGTTRSMSKGKAMLEARPQYATKLEFIQVDDFEKGTVDFLDAVQGVDGVVHVASPLKYDTTDNEKELILPAIQGVKSVLEAAAATPSIRRIVLTSSFASVVDMNRKAPPYFSYTGEDWNPLTYEEAIAPSTNAVVAYRGSKKFAELEAWNFVKEKQPHFDLVTLCPPMTFGPVRHPVDAVQNLNESNVELWKIASGASPLPVARVPFWIDVRDLAQAHVEALVRPEVGGRRYVPAAPEQFSYGLAAEIIEESLEWARGRVTRQDQAVDSSHGIDGETAARELGFRYRPFKESVVDLVRQAETMQG